MKTHFRSLRNVLAAFVVAMAALVPAAHADAPNPNGRTYAVLVGIADYPSSPLPRTDVDARRIGEALAAQLPAERLKDITDTDRDVLGTPRGVVGPLQARMNTFPPLGFRGQRDSRPGTGAFDSEWSASSLGPTPPPLSRYVTPAHWRVSCVIASTCVLFAQQQPS